MSASYEKDVLLWSQEQARLLRTGQFGRLDIEHLADEIEDVGRSEKRELASRMAVLLAHLLKWRLQPETRTPSWRKTISHQRQRVELLLKATPSLKTAMSDADWRKGAWLDAISLAAQETGLDEAAFPETCPWEMTAALDPAFWPD
ncbi:MAG TPA: DUF29 domain-containing protein [Roseiarcus sp.]|nr:DUF29 domain-containing protein [Roseiarcus sp.]